MTAGSGQRSPWRMLAVGVVAGLCTIAGIGAYTYREVRRLRDEQTAISERNRKDSLQLLRIQNDLGALAVLMRDMADGTEPYPLYGWQPAFERVRQDLNEATRLEQALAPSVREPAQQQRLAGNLAAYWTDVARMFDLGRTSEAEARGVVRNALIPQQRAIDGIVSRFLVVNNQVQEEAASANRAIYDRVGRQILLLVSGLLIATGALGLWVVASNRRAFREVEDLNAQLRTLSQRMLRVQEDVQRSLSRELHDDFGQIVAAIGTLLGRVRRHVAGDAAMARELEDVRTIAQQSLDRIRSRSQWLHPGVLDDFGLARALEGCVEQFQRQTGIRTHLASSGQLDRIREDCAIHVYRIVQEALNNAARHSGSADAWVRIDCRGGDLRLAVEDHGSGMRPLAQASGVQRGMGMVSMRERAELIGGELQVAPADGGGTVVHLHVPGCLAPPAATEVA
jgi:signal transduction histidine kinase